MRRPYFFELFTVAALAAFVVSARATLPLLGAPPLAIFLTLLVSITAQAVIGIGLRAIVSLARRDHAYLGILRSAGWWMDTLRLILGATLVIFTYGWIKLVTPVLHPALFDQALWDFDQKLCFGVAPTVFVLGLFGDGTFLRVIDWLYANIFFASTVVAFAFFLSHPSRRIRVAFANGYAVLWVAGAWLYFLVPSLGPAYRFPEIWLEHAQSLRVTQTFQALLMRNYQNVLRAAHGETAGPIVIAFGIGAFPSLHVAFQTYVFLWMRRLWTSGEVLFGLFAVAIFLGSMITGWHYLVDGIAGFALALGCYAISARAAKLRRWLELRRA